MKRTQADDRVGDLLEAMGAVTRAQLADAVARQQAGDRRPLGELLIALGYVSADDVEHALLRQRARRGDLAHADGVGLLEKASQCARRASVSIDELTAAATELTNGGMKR